MQASSAPPLLKTDLPLPLYGTGKVRDTYDLGDKLLIVATDRISAFDSILPTGILHKGQVVTALSAFWFNMTKEILPNHMISAEWRHFPSEWRDWPQEQREQLRGRSMIVKKAERIDIECVARGYLAGSGWEEYKEKGTVAGIKMPPTILESGQLYEPIFTPATKSATGHDENINFEQAADIVGHETAERLRTATLAHYRAIAEFARSRGIIIADTKLEFGWLDGEMILIDEIGTPDSSRFWEVEKYRFGKSQWSLDKQYVRDWLLRMGWNKEPPAPALPDDVAHKTSEKYLEAHRRITRRDLLHDLKAEVV